MCFKRLNYQHYVTFLHKRGYNLFIFEWDTIKGWKGSVSFPFIKNVRYLSSPESNIWVRFSCFVCLSVCLSIHLRKATILVWLSELDLIRLRNESKLPWFELDIVGEQYGPWATFFFCWSKVTLLFYYVVKTNHAFSLQNKLVYVKGCGIYL